MVATDEHRRRIVESQNGDHGAFEALIKEHQRMIHSLCYRMTGSLADAEDRILQRGASPQLRESLREVLASLLEKEMLIGYRYGPAGLGEIALRNGVPQGIEALLQCESPVSTSRLACLRKYIDLRADDAKALAAVQSGLGRWRWDDRAGKFVLGNPGIHVSTRRTATGP
jgi:hypothetical protein